MPVFLAPWFLLAAAAAAIPVVVHLLHQRKPRPMPFSTLRFLREAVAKTRRSRSVTHLLTLLMRVLIILLLAAAFSRPKVRFATWLPEGRRTLVLVLDGTASMQYRDGDESAFDRARAWAAKLVESLDDDDRVALVVAGLSEPKVVFPPISDHVAIARALKETAPGSGSVALVRVLADILSRLSTAKDNVGLEVHLFSDFQQANWNATEAESLSGELAKGDVLVCLNHVRPAVLANAGITKAAFYPPAILGTGDIQANCTLRTSADYTGENTLRLLLGDRECATRSFSLRPGQTLTESLQASVAGTEGVVSGQLEIGQDALAADNVYRFCLPRFPGIPILLVDGSAKGDAGSRDTFFLQYAIQPRGQAKTIFLPRVVDWPTFVSSDPREFRVVFVCNPPALDGATAGKLDAFAESGGTVFLLPGESDALQTQAQAFPALRGLVARKEVLDQETALAVVGTEKPGELENKVTRSLPALPAVVVRRRLVFTALPTGAVPVYQYAGGGAFLFEVPHGSGSLWVSSVSANRDWSEWPLSPFFVVLQQELIKSAARRNIPSLITTVGGALPLDWTEEGTELDFKLVAPSGKTRVATLTRANSRQPFIVTGFEEPGFYRIERQGEWRAAAVNVPPEESDLSLLAREELAFPMRTATVFQAASWEEQQQVLTDLHQGRPLWPWLLCLAFLLAVVEELFANIRSRAAGLPTALRQFLRRGGTQPA